MVSILLAAILLSVPPVQAQPRGKRVSLMPLWSPQAQFAGYYVALEKGIYARHGIDLEILKAGPGHSPVDVLKDGEADFAILWLSTALRCRDSGVPLVNLGQIVQRSSLMLISKRASGIATIRDMEGKKVGLWGGDLSIPARTLFARQGVQVREVPLSHTVNLFLRGGIDVTSAMWYNEYHTIQMSGVDTAELNVIPLGEQGMDFPEDGLYVLESRLRDDPELVRAFVTASLEGWQYAFDHPEEAIDIVIARMREARLPANRVHERWMLARMQDLMRPAGGQSAPGRLQESDFLFVAQTLQKDGLIRSVPEYSAFVWRSNAGHE